MALPTCLCLWSWHGNTIQQNLFSLRSLRLRAFALKKSILLNTLFQQADYPWIMINELPCLAEHHNV